MTDALARVPPGPPCPNCGCTESLEALDRVCRRLRNKKHRRAQKAGMAKLKPGSLTIGKSYGGPISLHAGVAGAGGKLTLKGGSGGAPAGSHGFVSKRYVDDQIPAISIADRLTCASCGIWFAENLASARENLRDQLRALRIELDGAIGCLGGLAEDGG